jgi:hypothetical protein
MYVLYFTWWQPKHISVWWTLEGIEEFGSVHRNSSAWVHTVLLENTLMYKLLKFNKNRNPKKCGTENWGTDKKRNEEIFPPSPSWI